MRLLIAVAVMTLVAVPAAAIQFNEGGSRPCVPAALLPAADEDALPDIFASYEIDLTAFSCRTERGRVAALVNRYVRMAAASGSWTAETTPGGQTVQTKRFEFEGARRLSVVVTREPDRDNHSMIYFARPGGVVSVTIDVSGTPTAIESFSVRAGSGGRPATTPDLTIDSAIQRLTQMTDDVTI